MKIILCGPLLRENEEKMIEGASPAACRFMNNMELALKKNGYSTLGMVYLSNKLIDKSILNTKLIDRKLFFKDVDSILTYQNNILKHIEKGDIVIMYNMIYAYFGLCEKIRKRNGIPVLLLADYTDVREEKGFLKKMYAQFCAYEFKKFRRVISLAPLPIEMFSDNTIHIDICGGINFESFKKIKRPMPGKINIMYAGLLNNVTGVDMLIEAIKLVQSPDVSFWFSGKGELENRIQELEKEDSRVKYMGFMNSDEYYTKLNEAHIFVNPRNMSLRQNMNNFPSKILEYLATGRIIVSTKFSGCELFENNIIWSDSNPESIAKALSKAIEDYMQIYTDTYERNTALAQKYDWTVQARRIVDFIND